MKEGKSEWTSHLIDFGTRKEKTAPTAISTAWEKKKKKKRKQMCAGICRRKKKQINCFFFPSFFFFLFSVRIHSRQLCYCCRTKKRRGKKRLLTIWIVLRWFQITFLFFFFFFCVSFASVQRAARVGLSFAKGKTRCSNDIYVRVGCMWACVFVRIKENQIAYFSSSFFFCSLYVGAFATPVLRRKKGLYCVYATRGTGKAAKKKSLNSSKKKTTG